MAFVTVCSGPQRFAEPSYLAVLLYVAEPAEQAKEQHREIRSPRVLIMAGLWPKQPAAVVLAPARTDDLQI